MEEALTKSSFNEESIFNNIKLQCYLKEDLPGDNTRVFICGKMFEHSLQAKYSFKACEFLIYLPFNNKLFFTEMHSEDCFTNTLKWNYNFFKKIRLCLEEPETIKDTYFAINYEKKETNRIIIDINLNNRNEEKDDLELEYADRNIYLELHMVVQGQDLTVFKMLLKHIIDDQPYITIMNKVLELDKIESEKLEKKQKKLYETEKETARMENEILQREEYLNKKKKDYLYKFYYLNKEKNKKIVELNNELKKEKKLLI